MPIEVTPCARSLPFHQGWSSMPPIGPARAIDLLPMVGGGMNMPRRMPGSVLPNGLRNPWAPYSGETYVPAAEGAAMRQSNMFAGSGSVSAGAGGGGGRSVYSSGAGLAGGGSGSGYGVSIGGGGNRSVIAPRAISLAGGGGGSVIAPSSVGEDGYREDDGWNGSLGRAHAGHLPDLSATAGALGHLRAPAMHSGYGGGSLGGSVIGGGGGWLNAPSSYGNHARMTPGLVGPSSALMHNEAVPRSYRPPPVAIAPSPSPNGHCHGRPRRGSVHLPIAREEYCADCHNELGRAPIPITAHLHVHGEQGQGHKRSANASASAHHSLPQTESAYRKMKDVVPHGYGTFRGDGFASDLERKRSGRSRQSGHSRTCSECSR